MPKNMNFAYLYDIYRDFLTDKQQNVIELYYNQDLSLAEISQNEGITRQGVRDNIKRGEAVLLEMEEKLGIFGRRQNNEQLIEQAVHSLNEIREGSVKAGFEAVTNEIDKILSLLEGID